jgi:hypothetical protein
MTIYDLFQVKSAKAIGIIKEVRIVYVETVPKKGA